MNYTKQDLAKLLNKKVAINYQYEPNKSVWIKGWITNITLASNPPHDPFSVDFSITLESKEELVKAKIKIPQNIGVFEMEALKETN